MGLAARSEVISTGRYRRSWFDDPSSLIALRLSLEVFPIGRRVRKVYFSPARLSSSSTALQGLARMTLADDSHHRLLPWAFRPSDTSSVRGPVYAGVACPPPSVRRVWLPSRRLTPSYASSALFHADSVYGVFLSELSPLAKLIRRSPPIMPRLSLPQALALTNQRFAKAGSS